MTGALPSTSNNPTSKDGKMNKPPRRSTRGWILVALLCGSSAFAGQTDLDRAIERYYAGYPAEAIVMLEPLARAGDVDAQYLLGNMAYALRQANVAGVDHDPVEWYRMAAERGSAEAAYALGAIFNNRWLESDDGEDARLAEFYYQQAADRGYQKAEAPLLKLATRNHIKPETPSMTYTNASFASKRETPSTSLPRPEAGATKLIPSGIELSGDPIADAARLQETLRRLGIGDGLFDSAASGGQAPNREALLGILPKLGVDEQLSDNLMKLIEHVQSVTEHSLAPGAN